MGVPCRWHPLNSCRSPLSIFESPTPRENRKGGVPPSSMFLRRQLRLPSMGRLRATAGEYPPELGITGAVGPARWALAWQDDPSSFSLCLRMCHLLITHPGDLRLRFRSKVEGTNRCVRAHFRRHRSRTPVVSGLLRVMPEHVRMMVCRLRRYRLSRASASADWRVRPMTRRSPSVEPRRLPSSSAVKQRRQGSLKRICSSFSRTPDSEVDRVDLCYTAFFGGRICLTWCRPRLSAGSGSAVT